MREIVVDIDGILTNEIEGFDYPKRTPNKYSIDILKNYKERGFKIILHTARYEEDFDVTKDWLNRYEVPYDKLVMGKPQAHIYYDDRATNQLDREVLCFSGGVDSVIAWHYLEYPQPIYIKFWHKYQQKEMVSIRKLEDYISRLKVKRVDGLSLGKFEVGENAYIPQRNFHVALIASHYGDKIYIVGIKGDNVPDKTPQAFDIMGHAMNFIKKEDEPMISIDSPFWKMTKPEIIKWFIDEYKPAYATKVLKKSVSCYDDKTIGSCGQCPACFRKWIALESAGLKSYNWFERDIRKWKGIKEYKDKISKGEYDIHRSKETLEVLEKYNL